MNLPYDIIGSGTFSVSEAAVNKVKLSKDHFRFSSSCAKGNREQMLQFSDWFSKLAETEGQVFQDASNFWLLRYHLVENKLEAFLSGQPRMRTLISPDMLGAYRCSTLYFAGFRLWNRDGFVTVTKTEGGVLLTDRLVISDEGKPEHTITMCTPNLAPIHRTVSHSKAEGPEFEADLAVAEKFLKEPPPHNYDAYQERIKTMPRMMDNLFCLVGGYLVGNVPLSIFVKDYLDNAVPVYKRIAAGIDKEEYAQVYQHEIDMLHDVSAACDAYQRGAEGTHELIVAAYNRYMRVDLTRKKKLFVI